MIGVSYANWTPEPDVFEALANYNRAAQGVHVAFSQLDERWNPHARNLTADAKKARRAKDKRSRQARKVNRSK